MNRQEILDRVDKHKTAAMELYDEGDKNRGDWEMIRLEATINSATATIALALLYVAEHISRN